MTLLKEGDGVNFQRASCTLDGCVKIYTNRVDGVATETGKLLSGLADSGNKNKNKGNGHDDVANSDDDEENEEGEGHRKKKARTQRSSEATLVSSFTQLKLKKMELEFSVDPLFKKASADFDEGGAKGLLLNHLAIDATGRIVFDSSDDQHTGSENSGDDASPDALATADDTQRLTNFVDVDIEALGAAFLPDLTRLNEQDICPSMKDFDLTNTNGSLDLPFLKAMDHSTQNQLEAEVENSNKADKSGILLNEEIGLALDDDDAELGGFEMLDDVGFGEGGEAWAREAALDQQMRVHTVPISVGDEEDGMDEELIGFDGNRPRKVELFNGATSEQENMLTYFDKALHKNWAGPEHWKIRRIKDISKPSAMQIPKKKEKEPFEIDFGGPMTQDLADALYTQATSISSISLPKALWRSKTRNLLPDDKHFNSRQLLGLFLKPRARLGFKGLGFKITPSSDREQATPRGEVDEAYWARNENISADASNLDKARQGDYDADFFQDDGLNMLDLPIGDEDEDFADAREHFSPPALASTDDAASLGGALTGNHANEGPFGAQLVTQNRRSRPEYVQYARVAKKVDVRKLKEEMWRSSGLELVSLKEHLTIFFAHKTVGETEAYCGRSTSEVHIPYEQSSRCLSSASHGRYFDFVLFYLPPTSGK
jgi:condensin complex subunit 2